MANLQQEYTEALLAHAEESDTNFPYWQFLERRVEGLLVEALEERASYEAEIARLKERLAEIHNHQADL
jgi:phage shock protein A